MHFALLLLLSTVATAAGINQRSNTTICTNSTQVVSGRSCTVSCNTAGSTGSYAKKHVTCIQDCVNECAADSRCVKAEYHSDTGYCYFKHKTIHPADGSVVDAVKCDKVPYLNGTTTVTTSTTTVTSTLAIVTTAATTGSAKAPNGMTTAYKVDTTMTSAATVAPAAGGCNAQQSTSTSTQSYGPGSTLLPAVHWEYPVNDIRNLAPIDSSDLYYSENGVSDPAVEHLFASLSTTFNYKAVVLDHSIYVSSVSCSPNGILIQFNSADGYNFAKSSWSATDEFVLVTYTDGCGASDTQRTFWLVDAAQYIDGTFSILVKVEKEVGVEDMFNEVQLVWGTYQPPSSSSAASQPGSSTSSNGGYGSSYTTSSSGSGSYSTNRPSSSGGSYSTGTSSTPGQPYSTYNPSQTSQTGTGTGTGGPSQTGQTGSGTGSGSGSGPVSTSHARPPNNDGGAQSSNGQSCGAAPAAVIDGFPAADCGDPDFDDILDDAIGYFVFDESDFDSATSDFFNGVDLTQDDFSDDGLPVDKRRLFKRCCDVWGAIKSVGGAIVDGVKTAIVTPGTILVESAKSIPVVGSYVAKFTDYHPHDEITKDINLGPNDDATSPWGPAVQIYKSDTTFGSGNGEADIALYCVNCGVKGSVKLSGSAYFVVPADLKELNVALDANIQAGLNLGLVAHLTFKDTKKKTIFEAGIPGLGVSVTGLFSAGVYAGIDAVGTVDIEAQGEALVGVSMSIPNFSAVLDLQNSDNSKITGIEPQFQKEFKAKGSIKAKATISLPVKLSVGLAIPLLNFDKSISLIEEPALIGTIVAAGNTGNEDPQSDTCNNGIEAIASATNEVRLDVFQKTVYTLNTYDSGPLLSTCVQLAATTTTTVEATTTTEESSSTTEESSTTTEESSTTTTEESSSTTDEATTTTEEATTTTEGSTSTTEEATTTTEESTSTTDESTTTTTEESSSTTEEPSPTTAETTSTTEGTDPTDTPVRRSVPLWPRQSSVSNSTTDDSQDTTITDDETDDFSSDPDQPDQEPEQEVDSDDDADGPESQFDGEQADDQANAAFNDPAFNYTTIVEMHNAFNLAPGANGNLYAAQLSDGSDPGLLWATDSGIVVADNTARVLFYYPDVMAAYNVSRIRLGDQEELPVTADVIGLALFDYDQSDSSNPEVYFAVTPTSRAYALVLCDFSNGADSKLFAVNGDAGYHALLGNENLRYTVTGGVVEDCDYVFMVPGSSK